jgi:hypothetical protein
MDRLLNSFVLRSSSRLESSSSNPCHYPSSFSSSLCISSLMSFCTITFRFNGLPWKANHCNGSFQIISKIWTFPQLFQKKQLNAYYKVYKIFWRGSNSDQPKNKNYGLDPEAIYIIHYYGNKP